MEQLIASIAKEQLSIKTLEARNSDCLDFHEVSIWQVRRALEAAYRAGFDAGQKARRS